MVPPFVVVSTTETLPPLGGTLQSEKLDTPVKHCGDASAFQADQQGSIPCSGS
jgi:hypothetical protein